MGDKLDREKERERERRGPFWVSHRTKIHNALTIKKFFEVVNEHQTISLIFYNTHSRRM